MLKRKKKDNVKKWCKEVMHEDIFDTLEILKLKLVGHFRYYGISGNFKDIFNFNNFNKIWEIMKMPKHQIYVKVWY